MDFRVDRASDSCFLHWIIPVKAPFERIQVYRLSSNHSHSRQTDLGFEFPTSNYPWQIQDISQFVSLPVMFFWPGYRQTNKLIWFCKILLSVEETLVVFCCERPLRHPRWRWGWTPTIYLRPKEVVRAFVTLLFLYVQVFPQTPFASRYEGKLNFLGEEMRCLCTFLFENLFRMRNACFTSWIEEASCVVS